MLISKWFAPDRLRIAHFIVGTIALVIFLATGQYMHWWHVIAAISEGNRRKAVS